MSAYLALQRMYFSGQLHGVSAEVVHGDGVVPVAEVVLLTRRLLLPPHAAHSQQHSYEEHSQEQQMRRALPTAACASYERPVKAPAPAARLQRIILILQKKSAKNKSNSTSNILFSYQNN